MVALVLRDGMQDVRRSEWLIYFVSSPDTEQRSYMAREGASATIAICPATRFTEDLFSIPLTCIMA